MNDPSTTLAETMRAAGIPPASGAVWEGQWEQSGAAFAGARQEYLHAGWIARTSAELAWPADVKAALLEGLALFRDCPALRRLAWHCRHLLFEAPAENMAAALQKWPAMPGALHPAADLFYAYVFLAGLPMALANHRRCGIPAEVTRATFSDLPLWMEDFRRKHGRWGLSELQGTGWLEGHLRCRLFRLGRLQFRFEVFGNYRRAYRSRAGGRSLLLAENGQVFRPDGRYEGANGISAGASAWTAGLFDTAAGITGYPSDPRGFIRKTPITLPPGEWTAVLAGGDPVLGIHIPAGAPLTPESCGDAMRAAAAFFPEYFPEYAFRAFTCATWLFDPQLADYLPPESNLVRFQSQFYRYPVPGANDRQIMERVCGRVYERPADMPRATSLQRIVADHMAAGGRWYLTGGCFFAADIPRWGRAPYLAGTG